MNIRLKELRNELGLTLEAFGKRVGITRSAVGRIEKGERALTEQMTLLICREFNVNEEWLRHGSGEMFVAIDRENQLMIWAANILKDESNSFKKRFVRMLMDLNESDWETLEKIAISLHKKD